MAVQVVPPQCEQCANPTAFIYGIWFKMASRAQKPSITVSYCSILNCVGVNLLKYLQAERTIEGHFGSTSVRESLKNERLHPDKLTGATA